MVARNQRAGIRIDDQWYCQLSAVPEQLCSGDQLTLTAALFQREFDEQSPEEKTRFYHQCDYAFEGNEQLQQLLNAALSFERQHKNRISLHLPPEFRPGIYDIKIRVTLPITEDGMISPAQQLYVEGHTQISVIERAAQPPLHVNATLQRTFIGYTKDSGLWPAIRNRTAAIRFERYKSFIDCVFCDDREPELFDAVRQRVRSYVSNCTDHDERHKLGIYGPSAYGVLKLATQAFLTLESGVVIRNNSPGKPEIIDIDKERILRNDFTLSFEDLKRELAEYLGPTDRLPYLNKILKNLISIDGDPEEVLPYCNGVLQYRASHPSLMELIWTYWLEEGMLVQTMNAIALRFQNRSSGPNDPLGELEFDPLRPLNNLIWGYIQDDPNRLTVQRRAYEYHHQLGLSLMGKAVSDLRPADSRSKFIEEFHNLLAVAARFYQQDADTTVIADGFPLLNALKEVNLVLAEGAQNQFGDLTWTSRTELLMMQWMLARPETKEFLRGRYMVAYPEPWMGAVDSMRKLQKWGDASITNFYDLAVTGERILLSARFGAWYDPNAIEEQAKRWARDFKPDIQRYLHAYRAVTGCNLMDDVTDSRDAAARLMQPSVLIQRRLAEQISSKALPSQPRASLAAASIANQAGLPRPDRPKLMINRKDS